MFAVSSDYRQWRPWLLRALRLSRLWRLLRSPVNLLTLQLALHKALTGLESSLQEAIADGVDKTDSEVVYRQRLRQIIKDIADGIPWRMFGFNRPLMRAFSQNRAPGFLNKAGREDQAAMKIASTGALVLLHDITNVLRIGDLTVIGPEGPQVVELKKEGRKILTVEDYQKAVGRGGDLSSQASRMLELDQIIRSGQVSLGGTPAQMTMVNIPVATYHAEVGDIINAARQTGLCGRFLDRLLYVRAFRVNCSHSLKLPFKDRSHWQPHSSLDAFLPSRGHFMRNRIPYAAFPFKDEVVLELITGELIIETYLHIEAFKKYLRRAGWGVTDHIRDILANWDQLRESAEQMFTGPKLFNVDNTVALFTLHRPPFHLQMPPESLGMVILDFLKPGIITDTAEFMLRLTEPDGNDGAVGLTYPAEAGIWR